MRKKIIAGNWKMNMTPSETLIFLDSIKDELKYTACEVVFCVPFLSISNAVKSIEGYNVQIGAQNMHYLDKGAYTGEISAAMLLETGITYVIIGHSERRLYYNETDESINKKVQKAVEVGIKPIVCVGESLDQRKNNIEKDVIYNQIHAAFDGIEHDEVSAITIAYEPIWAIGTGITATDEQANEMCAYIRKVLNDKYGAISKEVSILYGGSVNENNVNALMKMSDIDGALVGGASLKQSFVKIVEYESL
jgi:triosephosphate isomerase